MFYFLLKTFFVMAFAAPLPSTRPIPEKVLLSLRETHQDAVNMIRADQSISYEPLKQIAFDEKMPLKTRWKSIMLLSEVYGPKSLNDLKLAVDNKAWFMRSAGLTALNSIDSSLAQKSALAKFKHDPSLLVRMKALEILKDSKDKNVRELLWQKIHSSDSFHQNRGLWIRQDIARVLLQNPDSLELNKWVRLLHDQEGVVKIIAATAVKKLKSNELDSSVDLSKLQKIFPLEKSI